MFQIEDTRLVQCLQPDISQITIPDSVTTIGKSAFAQRSSLTSVLLPGTVKTIGDEAFSGCIALRDVAFPASLRRLGNGCFEGCISLRSVCLPESVASLHAHAFRGCTQLAEVHLPKGLRRNIEGCTFEGCIALKRITIPAGVQQIKSGAFRGCTALQEVIFENPDVQIEKNAFHGCDQLSDAARLFIDQNTLDTTVTDIRSKASGAVGRLSNYTERHFTFCGVPCRSIEGVLQSFKCPDPAKQAEICLLTGGAAKNAGSSFDWKPSQLLYWQGEAYPRRSAAYQQLLDRLYDAAYAQDESFRRDLASLAGKKIDHRLGLSNPSETVLTRHEFVFRLRRLMERAAAAQEG